MCRAGGFYGNLNYTDSWRLPSQGRGMARRALTGWIQEGAALDSSGNQGPLAGRQLLGQMSVALGKG